MAISGAGFGRSLRDAFGAAVGGFDATVNGFVDIVTAPLWAPDYNDPATFNALLDDVYVRGERADYEVSALLVAAVRDKNMTVETLGMLLHNYVTAHIDVMATPHSFDDVPALELLKVLDADRVKIAPAMQNTIARHVLQHAIDSDHYQNVGLVYKILKWHFPDSLPPMAAALDTFATRHEDALAAMIVPGVAFDENSPLMTALQDIEDYTHRYNGVGRAAAAMIEAAQSQAMPELAAAIFQKIKTDTRKVLCANYMVPAMAAGLARQFLAGPFDACAYNHNDPADLMSDPDIVALRSYDQLIEQVGSYLTADARSLNESRKRIAHDGLQARLPAIDEFFAQDKIAMALSRLEVMVKSLRPDQKTIRDYAHTVTARYVEQGRMNDAFMFATDPRLIKLCGGQDALPDAVAEDIAAHFVKTDNEAGLNALQNYIASNRPALRMLGETLAQHHTPLAAEDILMKVAPVIGGDSVEKDWQDFISTVRSLSHEQIGQAQAENLDDVWQALERAEVDIAASPHRKAYDLPMSAAGLKALNEKIYRTMNVVQTQIPLIIAQGVEGAETLRTAIKNTPFLSGTMSCSETNIKGSSTQIMRDPDGTARRDSSFGFLTVRYDEIKDVKGQQVTENKLLAMPVITVDEEIFKQTTDHGGGEILRSLQMIAGTFNHDYFHHFTARIIGPYYNNYFGDGLTLSDTPYGYLMGLGNDKPAPMPQGQYGKPMSLKEQYPTYFEQIYRDNARWTRFSQGQGNYEYHALHLHNALYRQYMDDGPAGEKMRAYVTSYTDEVRTLGERMAAAKVPADDINRMKTYYANLLAFHLRRVVPHDHPLMKQAESGIDKMGIDQDYARAVIYESVDHLHKNDRLARLENVSIQVDVNPSAPEITAAQSARWHGCLSAVNVLNLLYAEKYQSAREQALPALRESLTVVTRDIEALDKNGGMLAYEAYRADKSQKDAKALAPPLLPTDDGRPAQKFITGGA